MRQSDLELYRWKFHNDIYVKYKRVQEAKSRMPLFSYWKEYAAFTSILPRGMGKSSMLKHMINQFQLMDEDYLVLVPSESAQRHLIGNFIIDSSKVGVVSFSGGTDRALQGIIYSNTHLLLDEFDIIERTTLDAILNRDWRSVSMVSTLR